MSPQTLPNMIEETEQGLSSPTGQTRPIVSLSAGEIFLRQQNVSEEDLEILLRDPDKQRSLVRRIDWTIMPLLCGTYMLQYVDKQVLSYGAIFDLFDTTGVTSDQYSWLASIFYFAFLISEWPSSYLAQCYPTGKIVSLYIVSWGAILMCTAACNNFAGLAVCRFLLGIFEAIITPAFMIITSMWYSREEQPARAGLFYCFTGVGSIFGGLLTYGIGQSKSWDVWRINFIVCGGLTIVWGTLLLFLLPDDPMNARAFTVEQKVLMIARTRATRTGMVNKSISWKQVKEVFVDAQVWILFLFVLLNELINGGINTFGKLIVKGFSHDDPLLSTAYGLPLGGWTIFFVFTGPWITSRFKNTRTLVMPIYLLPTLTAVVLLWKLPRENTVGLLMAYYIFPSFIASLVLALQMPAGNMAGYTKRVTASAFVFFAYCIGNIVGPHFFFATEAPIYETGCKIMIGCVVGQIGLAFFLRGLLIYRNKTRDKDDRGHLDSTLGEEKKTLGDDLTDFKDKRFRYLF